MRSFSLVPEDLALGQSVIVAARWLLVAAGMALALIAPASPELLRAQVAFVLLLAVCNFGLQAQILRRQPTLAAIVYAARAADIAIITGLIAVNGGFASGLYVFYFPAMAVAFSARDHGCLRDGNDRAVPGSRDAGDAVRGRRAAAPPLPRAR